MTGVFRKEDILDTDTQPGKAPGEHQQGSGWYFSKPRDTKIAAKYGIPGDRQGTDSPARSSAGDNPPELKDQKCLVVGPPVCVLC